MRTRNPTLITSMALALASGIAQAAQEADAHQLSSGAGGAVQQSHPILAAIVHTIFIIFIVGVAATILSTFINPRSTR